MAANTVVFKAGDKFKYLGCADPDAGGMQKIPIGTVVTLLHEVEEYALDGYFKCKYLDGIFEEYQFFKQSELEWIN